MKFRIHNRRLARQALWPAALALLGLTACRPAPLDRDRLAASTRGHNIVVVLLDAAAAGHFSFLGYERQTTPHLDALAAESVVFERAYAQASATPLSVLSIFTSRYPLLEHAPQILGEIGPVKPADAPSLGDLLAERFDRRLGMSASFWISEQFGYGPGFTEFQEVFDEKPGKASRVSDLFIAWLAEHHEEQFCAYLHYFEPHAPYTPPPPYGTRFDPRARGAVHGTDRTLEPYHETVPPDSIAHRVVALYDGNLAYADAQLQRIVEAMRERGIWDRTIFVLISDHGEAFWRHDVRGHGRHAYEEFIRVPLLIHVPELRDRPRRVRTAVENVDVLPTLLDLADIRADWAGLRGRSLVPLLLEGDPEPRPAAAMFSRNHELGELELAMRRGRHKMIQLPAERRILLYDLVDDPLEQRNLFRPGGQGGPIWRTADAMAVELQAWIDDTRASWHAAVTAPDSLDAGTVRRLRSLGYLD